MKPYFKIKEIPYNLRNGYALKLPSTNSTYYGINSVLFRACLLWNQLPLYIKQSQSLHEFRSKMKTLRNIVCTCKICRTWFCNYVLWTNTTVIMISIIFQDWFLLAWAIQWKFCKSIRPLLNKDFIIIIIIFFFFFFQDFQVKLLLRSFTFIKCTSYTLQVL